MAIRELDLRDAAAELGVHYQTAYKWVRSGALEAQLVSGQYRLDPDEVAAFQESRQTPKPAHPASPRTRRDYGRLASQLYGLLVSGEETRARRMVMGIVETDGLTSVTENVLVPVMRRIGDDWATGKVSVSIEHRASAIVERILGGLHPMPPGRRRGIAVVASLSGDRHALPTTMAANALREDNWHVHHLGADVPASEILGFCDGNAVNLVVLTVTLPRFTQPAEALSRKLARRGMPALVGGSDASLTDLQTQARESQNEGFVQ